MPPGELLLTSSEVDVMILTLQMMQATFRECRPLAREHTGVIRTLVC